MKKIMVFILAIVVLVGCGLEANKENEKRVERSDGNDAGTGQMVEEKYYLTGELVEQNDLTLLVDSEEAGLVWVSFETLPEEEIKIHSKIKILFDGVVMESYPGQASGKSVEVIEPFDEAFVYTYEEMMNLLGDGDINHVIEWNSVKDMVAFAQIDLSNLEERNYAVYVASLYEEGDRLVGYVKGEMPDLAWFYDTLQIQTSEGMTEVRPPYKEIEMEMPVKDEGDDNTLTYELTLNEFVNEAAGTKITYYVMSGYKGELVMDYTNQSLYHIVDQFGDRENIVLEAEILEQGDQLTIAYKGKNTEAGYPIERYLTLDVRTSTEWSLQTILADEDAFYSMFEEKYDPYIREQEGVMIYLEDGFLVITYVPMDDMAERVYHKLKMEEISSMLNLEFEMPAS